MKKKKIAIQQVRRTHRGSIVSLHNKMFKKLLDAEETHELDLEEALRKNAQLERHLRKYEQALSGELSNIHENIGKEESYEERILRLEKENKELIEELKFQKMKTEEKEEGTANRPHLHREESTSTSVLHDRMIKKLLNTEAEWESKVK